MITYEKARNLGDVVDYVDFLFSVLLIIFETADVDIPANFDLIKNRLTA
ncbi:MAG: hypothetical protein JRJ25_07345 [Deltaproteobacteria bacterium]|nr:hypothetical protein [Deltaproteobacteria bacterium]